MTIAHQVHTALLASDRPLRMREIATAIGVSHTRVSSRITGLVRGCVVVRHHDGTFTAGKIAPDKVTGDADDKPNHWLAVQQLRHGALTVDKLADLLDVLPRRMYRIMRGRLLSGHVAFADGVYSLTDAGRVVAEAEG